MRLELACDHIAAEFLVPSKVLNEIWPQISRNDKPYQLLARRFKVSEIVAVRRLQDLGLINSEEFFRFYHEWQANELKLAHKAADDDKGGNFYASQNIRIGHLFGDMLTQSVQAGTTFYSDAWRLTNLKKILFRNMHKRYLGEVYEPE